MSAARIAPIADLRRFAVHTITTKPWSLEEAIDNFARAGFGGISIWRDTLEGRDPSAVRRHLAEAGLAGVSLVRGGFFAHSDAAKRREALEDNRRAIAEAEAIGLPLIVLVCGADPAAGLDSSREMIVDALTELSGEAAAAGVRLGIEPLHPMYADTRSAVSTLRTANDLALRVNAAGGSDAEPVVGAVVDVYHLWWDPALPAEIARSAQHNLLQAFHVCDWRVPTRDMLLDRGLMGEGCIDIPAIRGHVERAGFDGLIEVEIFSQENWATNQHDWLARIAAACRESV